ncbi:HIT/MYND zinc finger-like protein [Glarea lozoyensis ATCC 20868]|uniref:HIT/MYND zinc finger-like protein n=1 Tax=Glarea lozoyensis (strain ATCC 20868 / MF5171) TaxID=1116229 RepID=S3DME0_GLAL2|nr:HIT/MYND zinc finger-like protein [Glarea lozoyensis ATCC 20868]EPE27683.1 HIT/MYND zinc finger-like protein [Glarea lozoyensis ATCC 20868]
MNSQHCTVCSAPRSRPCKQCGSAGYCSQKCQEADLPTHQLPCESFSQFDLFSRPSDKHFLAIHFPVDEEKPKFFWLQCAWDDRDHNESNQYPDDRSIPRLDSAIEQEILRRSYTCEKPLSDTLFVAYREQFKTDGSKLNTSITAITYKQPMKPYEWKGPVVAYAKKGQGLEHRSCKDIEMSDFKDIADYFKIYRAGDDDFRMLRVFDGLQIQQPAQKPNQKPTEQPAQQQPNSPVTAVEGVRINCFGDQKILNRPAFESVVLSSNDPIFSGHFTSDIAASIGIPIFTRHLPHDPKWAKDPRPAAHDGRSPFVNQYATFLHLSLNPSKDTWPLAADDWRSRGGSAIIVRQDKKPLLPIDAEALCRYCQFEVLPLLSHSLGEYDCERPMEKSLVLSMICRPVFEIYWHKLADERKVSTVRGAPYYND